MTARQFKKWRELLAMTQDEIGTWLGVSRSTVNRWEGGTQAIPHMVGLLADEIGVSRSLMSMMANGKEMPEPTTD